MSHQRLMVDVIHCKNLISYSFGQTIQSHFIQRLLTNKDQRAALLLFEFHPVYTCGFRRSSSIITTNEIERLRSLGADFHQTDRGGLLTFHGPGQIVAYPILPLQHPQFSMTLRNYVDRLEQILVRTCRQLIDESRVQPGTADGRPVNYAGVWIDQQRKVAFMGVRYSRGITSHGISINCSIDMNWFDQIVPCGFDRRQITSLSDEIRPQRKVQNEEIRPIFLEHFQNVFHVELIETNLDKFHL